MRKIKLNVVCIIVLGKSIKSLPAGGASRSIAPNLVYTSCDGTILAGVFKYRDAIKNPDGKFNYRKRLHPNINEIRFTLCSIKGLFTPKTPKNPKNPPPPKLPPYYINA